MLDMMATALLSKAFIRALKSLLMVAVQVEYWSLSLCGGDSEKSLD